MAESSAANFTVGKIQKDWRQRVAKMYGQQKRNIIHTSSTAYEQDHSAAAPLSSVMNSHRFIRSPRRRVSGGGVAARGARAGGRANAAHRRAHEPGRGRESYSLTVAESAYDARSLAIANPNLAPVQAFGGDDRSFSFSASNFGHGG